MAEKAYKLLAAQENISNRAAKDLIDRGVVYAGGKKITVARGEINGDTTFKLNKIEKPKVIYEDEDIIAVDKPAFLTSEEVERQFDANLLHRLDKETSGVLLLTKNEAFHNRAVQAFKHREVQKEYLAVVQGKLIEPMTIDTAVITIKKGNTAFTKVVKEGQAGGQEAITHVTPLMIEGKLSKIKVVIETGRTHQIRAHLKSVNTPIQGDTLYGAKPFKRVMLHAHKISLLGYEFESPEPKGFLRLM
jgi:23S rRNA-/tRNA-specific pseudouridylate synthase